MRIHSNFFKLIGKARSINGLTIRSIMNGVIRLRLLIRKKAIVFT